MAAIWLLLGACIGSALTFVWVGLAEDNEPPAAGEFFDRDGEG